MRRLKYFFTVAEGEKVTEKCFRRILLSSALGILLCMTCLISTTWALFTATLVSEGNSIEVGTFTALVTVKCGEEEQSSAEAPYQYLLVPGKYTVTIANDGTAKGYCLVDLQKTTDEDTVEKESFTTGTLYADSNEQRVTSVSFAVTVEGTEQYTLKVTPCWGAAPADSNVVDIHVGEVETPSSETSDEADDEQEKQENKEETSTDSDETTAPAEEEKQEESKEQVSNETTAPTETQTQTQQSTDTTGGGSGDTSNTDATKTDNGETTNGETPNEDAPSEPTSTQETIGEQE